MVFKDPFAIFYPTLYKKLDAFLGRGISLQGLKRKKLENILDDTDISTSFSSKALETKSKEEPYFGTEMVEFVKHFDKIMDFYLRKIPTKKENYDYIYKIFIFMIMIKYVFEHIFYRVQYNLYFVGKKLI